MLYGNDISKFSLHLYFIRMKRRNFFKLASIGAAGITLGSTYKLGYSSPTIPGQINTPYPTINNLAVEWLIDGDDNMTGVVTVYYREKGHAVWRHGMPLFRVPAGENIGFTWANKHSGSIFGLKPDTEYEIRLILNDPDVGSAERTVTACTRPVPEITDNAEIIEIEPGRYGTLETKDGISERPVVYRCSGGNAIFTHIDLNNRRWVYIEGLVVENR